MKIGTKYFIVESGPEQGQYCAYCADRLVPEVDETTNEFTFKCLCLDAQKEFALSSAVRVAEAKLDEFYEIKAVETKKTFLRTVSKALRLEADQYDRELNLLASE